MNTYYFAEDGTYGCTEHVAVLDTSTWTAADWEAVDAASDGERLDTALAIAFRHATTKTGETL